MINIDRLTEFRLILHEVIYKDDYYMNKLINEIKNRFDIFTINLNNSNMSITMKIKKTNIKKNSNYSHTVDFYSPIITDILGTFLSDNEIIYKLKEYINSSNYYNLKSNELEEIFDIIRNKNYLIMFLYNLTPILDNTIVIYL